MTFAASITLVSAGIALYVAVLSRQLSRAPGWAEQRFFSVAALSVAAYGLLNIPTTAPVLSDDAVVSCSRLQVAAAALHSWAWLRYSSVVVGRPGSRTDRLLVPVLAVCGLAGALTPWLIPGGVRTHVFAPIGAVYRTAVMTTAADLDYALVLGLLSVPAARFARAWRRGVPNAAVQLLSLVVFLLLSVNDVLVSNGLYAAPYLVDIAFLVPVVAVGYVITGRFVGDAREHQELRHHLEREVQERTADLVRTQAALHKAEKLAALGQFAAGVAHEVNNPAAVVNANLDYLSETNRDALAPQALDALAESKTAMQRIAVIVRQLLDAGRLAASPESRTAAAVRKIAGGAFSVARARLQNVEFLRYGGTCRPFLFAASPPAAAMAAVREALAIVEQEPGLRRRLGDVTRRVLQALRVMGFDTQGSQTPIVPFVAGSLERTFEAWRQLSEEGLFVNVVLPPAVPAGSCLIRMTFTAAHTDAQVDRVLDVLERVGTRLGIIGPPAGDGLLRSA